MRVFFSSGLFLLLTSGALWGYPLTWNVAANFDDQGTLAGTFVFDADTGAVSNWNIAVTAGSTLGAFVYTPATSTADFSGANEQCDLGNCIYFIENGNGRYLLLGFTTALTDNGGNVTIEPGSGIHASYECANCVPTRYVTAGTATAPVPQTISFDSIPSQIFGVVPFPLAAQSNVLLPVTFTSTTPAVCRTSDSLVQLLATGTCSVTASQAGNSSYQSASVTHSFTVSRANVSGTLLPAANSPFQAGPSPYMVATADFNGDGYLDLAFANNSSSQVTVLLGNGNGGFSAAPNSPFSAGPGAYFIAVGDFNGDGIPDLVIPNEGTNNVTVLLGQGGGNFAAAPNSPFTTGSNPSNVAIGDFNGDGIQDLAVADDGGGGVTILLGNGSGGFTQAPGSPISTGTNPLSVAVGDFNGDGIQDLAVANYNGGSVSILLGNGSGGFSAASAITGITNPSSVAVGDFNGDGIQDLAIADLGANGVRVYLGNGSAGFSAVSGSPFGAGSAPRGLIVGDFNGDGIEDIATANQNSSNMTLLLGNGSGGFTAAAGSPFGTGTLPLGLALGDFNGDGIEDVAIANSGSNNVTVLLGSLSATSSNLTTTSPASIVFGTSVPLTLTVSNTVSAYTAPTGVATFFDGSNVLGTASQTSSPYTFTVTSPAVGSHTFSATYGGGSGSAGSNSNAVAINVVPPLTISIAPSSISTIVGGSFSASFSATGGFPPYTFSAAGLPTGVTLGSGSLSGSTAQAGTFTATVTVTDRSGASSSALLTINVLGLTTTTLPNGTAGLFYAFSLGAAGGTAGYTFSASGLPPGMSFTSYGYLNGTVTTAGTYSLNISVSSGGLTASTTLTLTIVKPQPLTISSAALPSGPVNVLYSQSLGASGGLPPYTWAISSGAPPPGLSLSPSGTVSGTPSAPGSYSFGVIVTDTAGATATATASITIQAAPLVITTQTLPSGMYGVDYPTQQLTVTGGIAPYTWVAATGTLPPGMALASDGVLGGTPQSSPTSSSRKELKAHDSSSGTDTTYSIGVTVTDHANTQSTAAIPLDIRAPSPNLILTAGALTFAIASPASSLPPSQTVGVQSTVPAQPIAYTLSVNPAAPWLSITNGTTTPDSIKVSLTSAALNLTAASYQTTLSATCTSTACVGSTQSVTVTLNVTVAPANLHIETSLLSFATTNTAGATLSQPINLTNSGGGSVGFASVSCEAPWCVAGPSPATLAGGASAAIPVTVDPTGLGAGFYRTQVDIVTSAGRGAVAVTLFISPSATIALAPTGAQFNMLAGGAPGNPTGSFLVAVNSGSISWNAALASLPNVPAPGWLVLGTPAGSSTATQPGSVSFSIDPAAASALAPGAYYGAIEVTSADVSNSPAEFEVVLNVAPANTPVAPDPEPGGLLFITSAGGVLPPETVTVYSASTSGATFQASAATVSGGSWLSVSPATGTVSATSPGTTLVNVDTSNLGPGVYQGGVSYSLSATAVRTVNVTLIITGSGQSITSALPSKASPHSAGCTPSRLVPAQTGLVNSFSQPAGWPTPLQIVLSNDCGVFVTNGQIVATFSNGDPPVILPIVNQEQGLYSATWAPAHASSQVSITVTANAPGFQAATSQITGAVVPNAVPVITPNGAVHSFDPLVGGALAPGTIIAIYGQNLAAAASQPATIPLPTIYNGTSVVIGGMQSPLYYVSPSQVNVQIPFELVPGSTYDVLVSANGALTNPQPIQLSPATPGLAAFQDGTLIAQHSDGSLVSQTSPAEAGEYLVAYLAGLGDTNVLVPSGTASPSSPLAEPDNTVVLTINGSQYPTAFVGLTPGLVGLYQMNFQVPTGLPAGNLIVTVSQNGVTSNQTILPYQP